ncbi:AcrR family transcriptional regulator [Sphingobium sp. B11D3B]|uniref:TetR/AcrR family transcriptional regulator n=1 Tax=Sphingobium sp. B11D3B TaxID=2940575 RepID=UPI002227FAEB|nr:TetR/AcrR family transcriptional regulator [Sphingobium sp. B11D3B]MCW2389611.1 AcrR family transcriptional regulator [Sphingobium sp. B11D3B]
MADDLGSLSDARGDALLQAATDLFLNHSFTGVSVDAVIARAGGSKRDLYQRFGDKVGLFRQVIDHVCQEVLKPLRDLPTEGETLEAALTNFGRTFVPFLMSPKVIALQRLVIGESHRFPEFIDVFVRQGPANAYAIVARLLESRAASGEIRVADPHLCGALFCDMLATGLQYRVMAGETVSATEIEARIRESVRMLVRPGGTLNG